MAKSPFWYHSMLKPNLIAIQSFQQQMLLSTTHYFHLKEFQQQCLLKMKKVIRC